MRRKLLPYFFIAPLIIAFLLSIAYLSLLEEPKVKEERGEFNKCATKILEGTFGFLRGDILISTKEKGYENNCVEVSNYSVILNLGFLRRGMKIKGFIGCQATDKEFLRFEYVEEGRIPLPGPIKIKGLNISGYRIFNAKTGKELYNTIGYLSRYHNSDEIIWDMTKGEFPMDFYRNDLDLQILEDGNYLIEIINGTLCEVELYLGLEPNLTLNEEEEIQIPVKNNVSSFCLSIQQVNAPSCLNLTKINASLAITNKLQLHAFDEKGRHIGYDYNNCTFKNESGGWGGVTYQWIRKECEYENEFGEEAYTPFKLEVNYSLEDSLCFLRNFSGYLKVSTEGLGSLENCSYIFKIVLDEFYDELCGNPENYYFCKLYKSSSTKEFKYFYMAPNSLTKTIKIFYKFSMYNWLRLEVNDRISFKFDAIK